MNLLSADNSFYRYKIENEADILESTFIRRSSKARHNYKKHFYFEVDKSVKDIQLVLLFLSKKKRPQDCVQANIKIYQQLSAVINIEQCVLAINDKTDIYWLKQQSRINAILFLPKTKSDLNVFTDFQKNNPTYCQFFWSFSPYNRDLKNSLTVKDIAKANVVFQTIAGLEIFNNNIPAHYELEPVLDESYNINWVFSLNKSNPILSVIIPTYNNALFLSNVIWHLLNQNTPKENYEIIIIDDGSQDNSSSLIYNLFITYKNQINLCYIHWSKLHPTRGEQQFFRPGIARNLAARYCSGKYLMFLDSDMLVPENFISTSLFELQRNDLIQFQRFHILQNKSKENPYYNDINLKMDTYIEDKKYWSELFFCNNWSDLPNYWKYTCTYALGLSKNNFLKLGMFKKYYISYGFEDTDLGYGCYKNNLHFKLIKIPLLHLTSYDMMQYKNSFTKRLSLLRVTAELFYLQHLDKNIYHLLGNYYRLQKPIKAFLRDLLF